MDLEPLLYQYNPWWENDFRLASIIEREKVLSKLYGLLSSPEIIMLTGLRRVGKTVTMKCLIRHLINTQNIKPNHCLYISMDDYQISNLTLAEVLDAYRKTMKLSNKEKIYVFFDEITYIRDFQIQLKNIYDKGNVKCIVSSSNSSALKDDSASLTGRKRIIEINPLDFSEFLKFKKIKLSKSDDALYESHFLEYIQSGGMPEYILHGQREYLVELIDNILMKDIVAHHGIRTPNTIKEFFILLMERSGKQVSINKLANILKISPDTAKRYLTMFEQTYLIHLVPRYGKTNETLLSAKKIYATDIGMRNITIGFRDIGAIFENIVFMKIKDLAPKYLYES
ncbi:MAG: ATP-binding protein, partial [Coxiellaceae bacterium]|nr:ATP-binding protein [Coxiellaceae bacterium]